MGLSALKQNRAVLDFNSLTVYFCGESPYSLDKSLPREQTSISWRLPPQDMWSYLVVKTRRGAATRLIA